MHQKIEARLGEIERHEGVRILFACESGSRAWGFASSDSDYDVRFIYLRPKDWYLSIDLEHKQDVIEYPLTDDLDVNGWDLRKALKLLRKSNPPLLEWFGSPIVYMEHAGIMEQLRHMASAYYSPKGCAFHYLHMVRGNYREYLQGEEVWIKKYFYVLRPLLALEWIDRDLGIVPTQFEVLVERLVEDPEVKDAIHELIVQKRAGKEMDRAPHIHVLSDFIDWELARLEGKVAGCKAFTRDAEDLDKLFRAALNEVWK